MTAAPRDARPPHASPALGWGSVTGLGGVRMTAEEFLALGETDERYELFDGVVVMSPSPLPRHQQLVQAIFRQLDRWEPPQPPTVFLDTDVHFGDGVVYRPDVSVYAGSRKIGLPRVLRAAPDLIVEVTSRSSRGTDLLAKRDAYDRFGVPEYWAIDAGEHGGASTPDATPPATPPATTLARCYRRQGARLVEVPVEGDALASVALPGFTLDLRPIRALARAQG
jgi:Uma2 family endonuclease